MLLAPMSRYTSLFQNHIQDRAWQDFCSEAVVYPEWDVSIFVNLIILRDAQVAGKTLFPGLFGRMFPEETSIRFCGWSKEDPHSLTYQSNMLGTQIE